MQINWTDVAQAIGSILGALISLIGFYLIYKQLKQTNRSLAQSNHTTIYGINADIYKFMDENSETRPYFYESLALDQKNKHKILSICELLADFFEFIIIEKDSLNPQIIDPWKSYMRKIYRNSPSFRYYMNEHRTEYCAEILNLLSSFDRIQNEQEFNSVDNLYQECFNDSSIPTDILKSWYQQQKEGIICLREGSYIIGALSYWYISKTDYQSLISGKIQEKKLHIKTSDLKNSNLIYISEIALKSDYRKKGQSYELLKKFLLETESKFTKGRSLKILALGYSNGGIALLQKIGFKLILDKSQSPDKQPLYELEITDRNKLMYILSKID